MLRKQATPTARDLAYIKTARDIYEKEGEIEIDNNAAISKGRDAGAYVAAWVWVSDEEREIVELDEC